MIHFHGKDQNDMKNAYLFCHHTVPYEHPNAVRLLNTALILQEIGYDVSLFGYDFEEEIMVKHRGVRCTKWQITRGKGIARQHLRSQDIIRHFIKVLKNAPDIIMSCIPGYTEEYSYLKGWAKENNVPFIQNLCEWYSYCNFRGKFKVFRYARNEWLMRFTYTKVKNIVGISTMLTDYYEKRGANTLTVPTLVDLEEYVNLKHQISMRLCIAYAGKPAAKDLLANVIFAIGRLSEQEMSKLEFHIYGATAEQLYKLGISQELLQRLSSAVHIHGYVPYKDVARCIADADFTILLRPNQRYAQAGFPTKVGESLACGTPVIANLTSDLKKYLVDGENSLICWDDSVESCLVTLRRAIAIRKETLQYMREKSYSTARTSFDYHAYTGRMQEFLAHLQ